MVPLGYSWIFLNNNDNKGILTEEFPIHQCLLREVAVFPWGKCKRKARKGNLFSYVFPTLSFAGLERTATGQSHGACSPCHTLSRLDHNSPKIQRHQQAPEALHHFNQPPGHTLSLWQTSKRSTSLPGQEAQLAPRAQKWPSLSSRKWIRLRHTGTCF